MVHKHWWIYCCRKKKRAALLLLVILKKWDSIESSHANKAKGDCHAWQFDKRALLIVSTAPFFLKNRKRKSLFFQLHTIKVDLSYFLRLTRGYNYCNVSSVSIFVICCLIQDVLATIFNRKFLEQLMLHAQ